jgi:Protein of unknown function (DUF2384)
MLNTIDIRLAEIDANKRGDTIQREHEFEAMHEAFRRSGGMMQAGDLARLLQERRHGQSASLSGLLRSAEVFAFTWASSLWVPMFQFDLSDLSVKWAPRCVRIELGLADDPWAVAQWFSQPNSWIGNRRPLDLIDTDVREVLNAARADRFVANA